MLLNDFSSVLTPGEKLLWTGKPGGGVLLRKIDGFAIPFSMIWFGFAIFWESKALQFDGHLFEKLWGVPFLLGGFYISVGRFFIDIYVRRNTSYALTNNRVLILKRGYFAGLQAFPVSQLPYALLETSKVGYGSIVFRDGSPNRRKTNPWVHSLSDVPSFLKIPDAANVFNMFQQAQQKAQFP